MLSIHGNCSIGTAWRNFYLFCISWNKWVGLFHSIFNVQSIKKYKAKQNNYVFSDNLGRFSLIFGHNGFSKVCVIIWPFFAFFVEFSLQPVRCKGDIVVKGFGLYMFTLISNEVWCWLIKFKVLKASTSAFRQQLTQFRKTNITVMCTALLKLNSFSALITQVTTCMLFSFICWTKYTFTF